MNKVLNPIMALDGGLEGALGKLVASFQKYGNYIIILIGILLVAYGCFQVFKYFTSQQAQVSIGKTIAAFVIGGMFLVGGWSIALGAAKLGKDSVGDFGIEEQGDVTVDGNGGNLGEKTKKTPKPAKP